MRCYLFAAGVLLAAPAIAQTKDPGYRVGVVSESGDVATWLRPAGNDLVIDREVVWTLGFQRDQEDGRLEIGMGGAGGCSAWTEPDAGYGAAFVSRGLGRHDRGEDVWEAVRGAYAPRS